MEKRGPHRSEKSKSPRIDGHCSKKHRTDEKLRGIEEQRRQDALDAKAEQEWISHLEQGTSSYNRPSVSLSSKDPTDAATDFATGSKQKIRWDDPARHFVEHMKPTKQKFRIPPNRFDIPPGPHWDGIDRSNGFERKYFQKLANIEARKETAYRHDFADL